MNKSKVDDHFEFDEFFEGRYRTKRTLLSRHNYKLYDAVDTLQQNSRVLIQHLLTQNALSESDLDENRNTIASLQKIDSPNLFKIVNSKIEKTQCLLVLECFDGLSLADYSETNPGSSSLLLVFFQVILALYELHKNSILHLNLRPDNIFVGVHGLVKLGGVSLLRNSNHSHLTSSFLNPTPGYSAPEVWQTDGKLDETADVYSLGSLLFFCVTEGEHPNRILSHSRIPTKFRSIIQKSREVDVAERFGSVRLFEDAVLKLLSRDETLESTEDLNNSGSQKEFTDDLSSENPNLQKEPVKNQHKNSNKRSKNLIKKLGVPFKSIAEDFKEAWHDAKQEILQETRDLVKNKLLKSKNKVELPGKLANNSPSINSKKPDASSTKNGIIAAARRLKETHKSQQQKIDPCESGIDNNTMASTKIDKLSVQLSDSNKRASIPEAQSKKMALYSISLNFVKSWIEGTYRVLNPKIFTFLGFFLILSFSVLIFRETKLREGSTKDTAAILTNKPNMKILGSIFLRHDELSDWERLETIEFIKDSPYLYAKEGDGELVDDELGFRLEMKKGCKLRLLRLKGSKNGLKNRVELEIEQGEFVVNSNSSRLFIEIVDYNVRVYGRGVVFKVKGSSGNTNYYVKKGSLSIKLPTQRKSERVSPGQMFRVSNGVIKRKVRFDTRAEDF